MIFNSVARNHLWYDSYEYSGKFYLPECFSIRNLDHDYIDRIIKMRRSWASSPTNTVNPGSWANRWRTFTLDQQQIQNLHDVCDFFSSDKREKKIVFTTNYFTVYTGDPDLLKDIADLPALKNKASWFNQVMLRGEPNTVSMQSPKHNMRSYFRNFTATSAVINSIRSFLQAQEDIKMSRSLAEALDTEHTRRLFDHHFFDHDTMAPVNMLCMIHSGCIRKTMPIIADK
jgi:hypothetical protein